MTDILLSSSVLIAALAVLRAPCAESSRRASCTRSGRWPRCGCCCRSTSARVPSACRTSAPPRPRRCRPRRLTPPCRRPAAKRSPPRPNPPPCPRRDFLTALFPPPGGQRGDNGWALVRALCLVVWWFDPLVWLAAALSRRDGELACDEAVLKTLGPACRFDYGHTLLALSTASGRAALVPGATAMSAHAPQFSTAPTAADTLLGGSGTGLSCRTLVPAQWLALVNASLNPGKTAVTAADCRLVGETQSGVPAPTAAPAA